MAVKWCATFRLSVNWAVHKARFVNLDWRLWNMSTNAWNQKKRRTAPQHRKLRVEPNLAALMRLCGLKCYSVHIMAQFTDETQTIWARLISMQAHPFIYRQTSIPPPPNNSQWSRKKCCLTTTKSVYSSTKKKTMAEQAIAMCRRRFRSKIRTDFYKAILIKWFTQ